MIITIEMLKKLDLSDWRFIEMFTKAFPEGFEVTMPQCIRYADIIDFSILADAVLPKKSGFKSKLKRYVADHVRIRKVIEREYRKQYYTDYQINREIHLDWRVLDLGQRFNFDKASLFCRLVKDLDDKNDSPQS